MRSRYNDYALHRLAGRGRADTLALDISKQRGTPRDRWEAGAGASAEETGEGRTRKALIEEAGSLHRSQLGVRSELDEESRQKLQKLAEKMMPKPPEKNS